MIELFLSLIALMIFVGFISFAISFGIAFIGIVIIAGFVLGIYIVLRGYYLRWKFGSVATQTREEGATIIDTDYQDISDKK